MPAIKIKWDFGFQVDGGARTVMSKPEIEVDSYDVTKAMVTKVATAPNNTATLTMQPLAAVDKVSFVFISSDVYGDALTYTIDADAVVHKLNAPQIFLGGAVAFMHAGGSPQAITVTNGLANDVNLMVVVGRSKS